MASIAFCILGSIAGAPAAGGSFGLSWARAPPAATVVRTSARRSVLFMRAPFCGRSARRAVAEVAVHPLQLTFGEGAAAAVGLRVHEVVDEVEADLTVAALAGVDRGAGRARGPSRRIDARRVA